MVREINAPKLSISLVEEETEKLINWVENVRNQDITDFEQVQILATRLGAHYRPDGLTEFGFWTPELSADLVQAKNVYLEVLIPKTQIHSQATQQEILFRRKCLPLRQYEDYLWGVYGGIPAGTKECFGAFYWLRYFDIESQTIKTLGDCLAYSLPYGIYAPAEVYDLTALHRDRADLMYFQTQQSPEILRAKPPRNILQLHVATASPNNLISGLTQFYHTLGEKVKNNEPLTSIEENFCGYDAIQLLPIEPTIEHDHHYDPKEGFFKFTKDDLYQYKWQDDCVEFLATETTIALKKPNTHNWGYDIIIFGSAAVEPALLETLRPDELIELIATLHNFPTGPIQVIYDIVYGHADNQALNLLNRYFFKSPGMYGQEVNSQHPTVRAILLEMQRRKTNHGVDALRIDGGQDFQFFNPNSSTVEYDDAYLKSMSEIPQTVGQFKRYPFPIYEDGRPWPNPGWQEKSTYRDILAYLPDVFQWGPLIFAHNQPTVKDFWDKHWQRVQEIMKKGAHWVTGCANHDTMHRGSWVDPEGEVNRYLGKTLPDIFRKGYDNPAITMWVYTLSPGMPMDFINATMRAPWTFFRNTDDRYGINIITKEAGFLDWQIEPELYDRENSFLRLKARGFKKVKQLSQFVWKLKELVEETNYNLPEIERHCQKELSYDLKANAFADRAKLDPHEAEKLQDFARAYFEDVRDICCIWRHEAALNPQQTAYNLALRRFRLQRDWLMDNLTEKDVFERITDDDKTIFYGWRSRDGEQIAMVAHMGGKPITVKLEDWLGIDVEEWEIAIASPTLEIENLKSFELQDSQALLLEKCVG
jgi:hypothetical protein